MFLDSVRIFVKAGNGGNGAVHFHREKFVPAGGPDGGDGGKGGDVILKATNSVHTLSNFRFRKRFFAQNGEPGGKNNRSGRSGKDIVLLVPTGTVVIDEATGKVIADLKEEREEAVVARGGKGGLGNQHFATPRNQAPTKYTSGEPGEEKTLRLELKLIADVGLVGRPNAGKSTLISAISSAHPKVAEYPFTTIEPVLGTVNLDDTSIVVADIPGLIEGASKGKGLGIKFLKHIERTRLLLFLIDATDENPQKSLEMLKRELANYSPMLSRKRYIVALNKIDLITNEKKKQLRSVFGNEIFLISALRKEGIKKLLRAVVHTLSEIKEDETD